MFVIQHAYMNFTIIFLNLYKVAKPATSSMVEINGLRPPLTSTSVPVYMVAKRARATSAFALA